MDYDCAPNANEAKNRFMKSFIEEELLPLEFARRGHNFDDIDIKDLYSYIFTSQDTTWSSTDDEEPQLAMRWQLRRLRRADPRRDVFTPH